MIRTIDIELNAAHPDIPIAPCVTFKGSPLSLRVRNVPRSIGKWKITNVSVSVAFPDNSIVGYESVLTGGVWVATTSGCSTSGSSVGGVRITASGVDENGSVMSGFVLGKGDLLVLEDDCTITANGTQYYVHLVDDESATSPNLGDLSKSTMRMWDGSSWVSFGNSVDWANIVNKPDVYTKDEMKQIVSVLATGMMSNYVCAFANANANSPCAILSSDVRNGSRTISRDNCFIIATVNSTRYALAEFVSATQTARFVWRITYKINSTERTESFDFTVGVGVKGALIAYDVDNACKTQIVSNAVSSFHSEFASLPDASTIAEMTVAERTNLLKSIVQILKG